MVEALVQFLYLPALVGLGLAAYQLLAARRAGRAGLILRAGSFWVGAHWSPANKRLCVNLVPCVTIWFVLPGGVAP